MAIREALMTRWLFGRRRRHHNKTGSRMIRRETLARSLDRLRKELGVKK